jgi:hypothetical protein
MSLHVVSFSTGLSSALTALRVLDHYQTEPVALVFMDTLFEDDDNYRFMADFECRFGVVIDRITEGRNPYEVSHAQHVIPNQRVAPCTRRLKIEPFRAYLAEMRERLQDDIVVHIGYDFTEMHRCEPTRANYESLGYKVDFPLLWKPIEFRSYVEICRTDWGIEPPRAYGLGYTHANCGGRCVKQGHGDWIRTLINFPERYNEIEQWEAEMRTNPTNANYAILRSQTKDGDTPLTLRELRERYESGLQMTLFDMDASSACVVCGIGG